MDRGPVPRTVRPLVAGVPLLMAAACGAPAPSDVVSAPRSRLGSLAPASGAAIEAEVEAAYRAAWGALQRAALTADPEAAELRRWMTGAQLAATRRRLAALRHYRRTLRGQVELNPRVVSVTDTEARVRDCQDSSGWLAYDAAGRPLGIGVARRDLVIATLVKEGTGWKVATTTVTVRGC